MIEIEKIDQKIIQIFALPPRHLRLKNSAGVNGGLSGGSSVCDPHRPQQNFITLLLINKPSQLYHFLNKFDMEATHRQVKKTSQLLFGRGETG